jgi:hypothetical protein
MENNMRLLTSVKTFFDDYHNKHHYWVDAGTWTFWNVFWGLFPLWMGFFIFRIFQKKPRLIDFSDNGEFLIYGATMLAVAIYIVLKDYKTSTFPFRRLIAMGCVVIFVFIAVLFTGITAANTDRLRYFDVSREFIRTMSYWVYLISIALAFFLTGLDNRRTRVDILEERDSQLKILEQDFDKVGG